MYYNHAASNNVQAASKNAVDSVVEEKKEGNGAIGEIKIVSWAIGSARRQEGVHVKK